MFCPTFTDFLRHLKGLRPQNKTLKQHLEMAIKAYNDNKIIQSKYNFFIKKLNNCHVRGRTIHMKKEPSVW